MWIVAVAWIYVVGLMALTELSVVAGIMTFFLYCVFPLSILYYLTGSRRRAAKRERIAYNEARAADNARTHGHGDGRGRAADDAGPDADPDAGADHAAGGANGD